MTARPFFLSLLICILLFACQQPETTDNTTPTDSLVKTSVFPMQPLQVVAPANLRLSYTGRTVTDTSVFYQVMASYKGDVVGFDLSVPKGEAGKARLSSRGKMSDDLLHYLQGFYGLKVDSAARFGEDVFFDYSSLGALVSDTTVRDSLGVAQGRDSGRAVQGRDGVGRERRGTGSGAGSERQGTENKLHFQSNAAELYLDINDKDHWIELAEKDTAYRAAVIKGLTQP